MEPPPQSSPEGRAPNPGEPAHAPHGQQPPPGMQLPPGMQQQPGFIARLYQIKAALILFVAMLLNFASIYREIGKLLIPPTEKNLAVLTDHGLFVRQLVHDGEWWRHFNALLVPTGAIDLLICAWIFWSLGPIVERLLGTLRFLTLFFLAGAGGIALAEIFAPGSIRWSGPWVGLYVVFGALPGIVFGDTFSIGKTLRHPGTRSCAFWVVLGLVFAYISEYEMGGRAGLYDWQAQLAGMALGVLLGFALTAITTRPLVGIVLSLVFVGGTIRAIVASSQGVHYRDGFQSPGGTLTGGTRERDPDDEKYIDTADEVLSEEEEQLAEINTFLERWGPLPMPMLRPPSDDEIDAAEAYYEKLDKLALGTNELVDELDPARIRLLILLARYSVATQRAEEYTLLQNNSPRSQALAGAAFVAQGGGKLHDAADYLGRAVDGEGLATEWPEAMFLLGYALDGLHEDVPAGAAYQRFLRLVTERDSDVSHLRHRGPMIDMAREYLGR